MIAHLGNACCGCGLCAALCPKQAIAMKENAEGFLCPDVDGERCISCGLCQKQCPVENSPKRQLPRQVLAVKHGNLEDRKKSTSGGMFGLLSDWVLESGGVVYGAAFDEGWNVRHIRAADTAGRDAMRGSKYVQSDMTMVYDALAQDLKAGRRVLFTGTPCQCAAVRRLAETKQLDSDLLLLAELICEGVNSPAFFRDYLGFVAKGSPVTAVAFRSKEQGWKCPTFRVETEGAVYSHAYKTEPFCQCFEGSLIFREACHLCPHARSERGADITMGDFWAYRQLPEGFADDHGVSMVLVNTDAGAQAWEQVRGGCDFWESDLETALSKQTMLKRPVWRNRDREAFWQCYEKHGLEVTLRRYTDYGTLTRLKKKAKAQVKKLLKR